MTCNEKANWLQTNTKHRAASLRQLSFLFIAYQKHFGIPVPVGIVSYNFAEVVSGQSANWWCPIFFRGRFLGFCSRLSPIFGDIVKAQIDGPRIFFGDIKSTGAFLAERNYVYRLVPLPCRSRDHTTSGLAFLAFRCHKNRQKPGQWWCPRLWDMPKVGTLGDPYWGLRRCQPQTWAKFLSRQ